MSADGYENIYLKINSSKAFFNYNLLRSCIMQKILCFAFLLVSSEILSAAPDYWTGANGTEMARVGDAGNSAYSSGTSLYNGYGSVGYEYSIGKYEVTVSQYMGFIQSLGSNAYVTMSDSSDPLKIMLKTDIGDVAIYSGFSHQPNIISYNQATGQYGIINNQGQTPITYVSAIAGALYANWLTNGAAEGSDCLTGVYDFKTHGFTAAALKNADRSAGGYMLCSVDEWIKAGYYSPELNGGAGGYYTFATQSDTAPTPSLPTSEANTANIASKNYNSDARSYFTNVGSYSNSSSYYGTFDQEGNASEWTDTSYPEGGLISIPEGVVMSGISASTSMGDNTGINVSLLLDGNDADASGVWSGLRVVYREAVPEPSTYAVVFGVLALGFTAFSRRRK